MTRWKLLGLVVVVAAGLGLWGLRSNDTEAGDTRETVVSAMDHERARVRTSPRRDKTPNLPKTTHARPAPRSEKRRAQSPKGVANVDLAKLPDADDTFSTSPVIELSGKTLFHDGKVAPGVAVVAVRTDSADDMRAVAKTVSGPDGSYKLSVPWQGADTKILGKLAGYAVAEERINRFNAEVEVPPAWSQNLTLHPVTKISGRVVDVKGRPVAGAEVSVTVQWKDNTDSRNRSRYQNYSAVMTTGTGEFVIENVPPWESFVYASKRGFRPDKKVTAAPAANIELVLRTDGAFVAGRVIDRQTSQVVSGASANFMLFTGPNAFNKPLEFDTDSEGYYTAGPLPGGTYIAMAEAKGYVDVNGQSILEIDDGITSSGVDLLVHSGHTIRGRVTRLVSGEPVAGADVYVRYLKDPPLGTAHVQADDRGNFVMERLLLLSNSTRITAKAPALRTFQPVEYIGGAWLEITPKMLDQNQPVDIKMIGEARVRGTVVGTDGAPIPQLQIAIQSQRDDPVSANGQSLAFTGTDGKFEIGVAAPATGFRVIAETTDRAGASEPVSLLPGEEAQVEIRMLTKPKLVTPTIPPNQDALNPMPGAVIPGSL